MRINSECESYDYNVYGLNIKSEIKINEFMKNKSENYDVKFELGVMPQEVKEEIGMGRRAYYSKTKIWFHINEVASYYIINGDTVIVEPCENTDKQMINIYLMCSCLGFIMLQRDKVAIHGGTIVINNKGVIFTGGRGAGKSTLTTALRQKGHKFIADDVAATTMEDVLMVNPGFPYQKLCEDVMDKLGYDKAEHISFNGDNKVKYMIPAYEEFVENDVLLHGICELTVGDVEDVQIEEIKGRDKLFKVINNIYRTEFIDAIGGMSPKYMKKCVEVAKNIKFYKITRPKDKFTVDEQIERIESIFNEELEKVI